MQLQLDIKRNLTLTYDNTHDHHFKCPCCKKIKSEKPGAVHTSTNQLIMHTNTTH